MSDSVDRPLAASAAGPRRPVWQGLRGGRLHRGLVGFAAPLGLVNPLTSLLGIGRILPDDTFVASYPRSGNTWTRFILAYLLRGTENQLQPRTIDETVPDAYLSPDTINARHERRWIKSHEAFLDRCPRVIYVHRDCREALVSYWHFVRRSERYAGTFSEFLRSGIPARHGSWKRHMLAMRARVASDPSTIHVVRYDDLVERFPETVAGLAGWIGIGRDADFPAIHRLTSPAALEAGEQGQGGGRFRTDYGVSFYVDRGKGADWRSYWSAADLAWLARDRRLVAIMEELRYR